jgi:uncharacterized protein (TIGR00251 family)
LGDPIRDVEGGCEVDVWVVPGASRNEITGRHGDRIRVRVTPPAEGGRANRAVCALISAVVGRPVSLLKGETSRSKVLFIEGASESEVRGNLRN